jgi:ElaB/YqjD/DUF883 family membrane-anchored ribosome-binding protein
MICVRDKNFIYYSNVVSMKRGEKMVKGPVDHMTRKLQEMEDDVEDKIRENPMQSVGVAFVAGLLIGAAVTYLLKRR